MKKLTGDLPPRVFFCHSPKVERPVWCGPGPFLSESFPSFSFYSHCDQRAPSVRARWRQPTSPAAVGEKKKEEEERFTLLDGDLRGLVQFSLPPGLWTGECVSKSAPGLLTLLRFSADLTAFCSSACCFLLQPPKRHFVRRSWHVTWQFNRVFFRVVFGDYAFARRLGSTSNLRNFSLHWALKSASPYVCIPFLCKTLLILLKISVLY